MCAMKKSHLLPFALLPLLLVACGNEEQPQVSLRLGTLIGNRAEDKVTHLSQITWIKKSVLTRLVNDEENFLLLLHGSADTCTCYTEWHDTILSRYSKSHNLLIYGITLAELETDSEYYGLDRGQGYDTLAIFSNGKVKYQHNTAKSDDPFVTDYAQFVAWMEKRVKYPVLFTVDEEILDGFYEGNEGFTVYFGRDTCPDCTYLNRTGLRSFIDSHSIKEPNFFYIDFDPYRPSPSDPDYEERMVAYQAIKDKYGLSWSEDNPAGYGTGVFPTVYYVNPDGESFSGDVIEAAGVFYNESFDKETGKVTGSYFTKERYDAASSSYLTYLKDSKVETKYYEGVVVEGSKEAKGDAKKDLLRPYEEPIFNALLEYCVL